MYDGKSIGVWCNACKSNEHEHMSESAGDVLSPAVRSLYMCHSRVHERVPIGCCAAVASAHS